MKPAELRYLAAQTRLWAQEKFGTAPEFKTRYVAMFDVAACFDDLADKNDPLTLAEYKVCWNYVLIAPPIAVIPVETS